MTEYDSAADTLRHINRVSELLVEFVSDLAERGPAHDRSKLREPEKATYDEFTPKLKTSTYGSDEYRNYLYAMGPALEHHYAHNRHHPEFGEPGLEWRDVGGYEGHYEVSNYGDLRSVTRTVVRSGPTGNTTSPGRDLRPHVTPKGYLRIQLARDGIKRNHLVHRLVAAAFLPAAEDGLEINHRNGDKRDNVVFNLEWVTSSENLQHAYDIGLKDPCVKYVVHCPDLDITAMGTPGMERVLQDLGHDVSAAGIWGAMDRGGTHCGLTFEGTLLADYRRDRINGMTLVDLIEMLADWKAATERHDDGDLARSLVIQQERFGMSDQLVGILRNTAERYGWLPGAERGATP